MNLSELNLGKCELGIADHHSSAQGPASTGKIIPGVVLGQRYRDEWTCQRGHDTSGQLSHPLTILM